MERHIPDTWLHAIVSEGRTEQCARRGDDGLGRKQQTKWFVERAGGPWEGRKLVWEINLSLSGITLLGLRKGTKTIPATFRWWVLQGLQVTVWRSDGGTCLAKVFHTLMIAIIISSAEQSPCLHSLWPCIFSAPCFCICCRLSHKVWAVRLELLLGNCFSSSFTLSCTTFYFHLLHWGITHQCPWPWFGS